MGRMEFSNYCFLFGMSLLIIANLFMRLPSAPPIGASGASLPWRRKGYFKRGGYTMNVVGWLLWLMAVAINILDLIRG